MGSLDASGRARGAARWVLVLGLGLASACLVESEVEPEADRPPMAREGELPLQQPITGFQVPAPLPGAHCEIQVDGLGLLDMEEDYLPHVVQCENGGANLEALKAQAIAARSVAYYAIETSGSICNSQGCQVYGCGANPQPIHYQAVAETSGQYLMYNNTLTYGFYVAGDTNTAPPACVGVSGSTEGWVTYNEGQTGTNVEQTALGFIHDPGDAGYGQNRGCMSQWGARCLENNNGYDYLGILRFYYGDDIEVTQAAGECVMPVGDDSSSGDPPGTTGGPVDSSGGVIGDDSSGGGGGGPGGVTGNDDDPFPGGTAGGGSTGSRPMGSGGDEDGFDPALPTTFGEDHEPSGCACRAGSTGGPAWGWLLLVGLGGLVRRRR